MNALRRLENIKNSVSVMNGEFVSFINESDVVIKNKKDLSIWQIPFVESDNGFTFDGTKAVKLQGAKAKKDPIKSNALRLQKNLKDVIASNNYEEAIGFLKDTIRNLPYIEQTGTVELCSKCNAKLEPDMICKCQIDTISEEDDKKESLIIECMKQMQETFREFSKTSFIFDESGKVNEIEKLRSFTSLDKKELINETKNFMNNVRSYKMFKQALSESITQEVADTFFESFSWENEEFGTATARALTKMKIKHKDLNVMEALASIKDTVKTFYNEEPDVNRAAPWVYNLVTPNDKDRPGFLKFRTGAFTFEALKTMSAEISKALASKDLTVEELEKLGNYNVIVEYMIQTKQINDHVLTTLIEDFNKTFIKTDDDYQHNQLGFRNRDEQYQGWIKGWARNANVNLSTDGEA